MSYAAALDALTDRARRGRRRQAHDPRGPLAREIAPLVKQPGCTATTSRPRARSPRSTRARYGAPAGAHARGLPVPGDLRAEAAARPSRALVAQQLDAFQRNFGKRRPEHAQAQEPDALRRPHHRLDDRARGAAAPRPPADRGRDLQPAQAGHAARASTRRCATRSTTGPAAEGLRAAAQLALQHAQPPGPAADADRQPRPGLDPGRRAPGAQAATCSTSSSRAATARHAFSLDRREVPARRRQVQRRPRGATAARPRRTADDAPAACSAGRWPTAARPRCSARRSRRWASTAGPTSCCRCRPSSSTRPSAALPGAGFVGANVTIPHKEAALARRRQRDAAGARDRRGEHADVHRRRRSRPTTPTRPACSPRIGEVPASALVLGAGGSARAAVHALSGAGCEVLVLARTPEPGRGPPGDRGRPPGRGAGTGQLHPGRPARSRRAAARPAGYELVVDFVYRDGGTALTRRATGRVVDGLELLVRQGALSFTHWTGREAPLDAMRAAVHIP